MADLHILAIVQENMAVASSLFQGGGGVHDEFANKIGVQSSNLPIKYSIMANNASFWNTIFFLEGVSHPLHPTVATALQGSGAFQC